jgi:hypothetical protein
MGSTNPVVFMREMESLKEAYDSSALRMRFTGSVPILLSLEFLRAVAC